MIRSFSYQALPMRVVFGAGSLTRLPDEVQALGLTRVLVLCSPEQAETGQRQEHHRTHACSPLPTPSSALVFSV